MGTRMLVSAAALLALSALAASAQDTTRKKIPIRKDSGSAAGVVSTPTMPMDTLAMEWYKPTGTTCSTVDATAARAVSIKSDLYTAATMISPDSAKILALCAV